MCFPPMHTLMKNNDIQKRIICINILIPKPFLTQFLIFFSFKCPYTLDIFSYLYSTCTREWSKLVIKTTNGENNYHLCFWHQWPFGASQSWFQKFIIKSKLVQSIIYKKTSSKLTFEVFSKINIQEKLSKKYSFYVPNQKNLLCDILKTFFLCIHFPHQFIFFVNLIKVLNSTWFG
jgi:hypothetical protein